ncbi:MAG: hypothetical protein JNL22_14210 [Bacteroidales bacterium]|nr:hypothetical protein [Bacteroidales bacterium]
MKSIGNIPEWIGFWIIVLIIPFLFFTCEKETDKPTGNNKVSVTSTTAGSPGYFNVSVSGSITQTGGQTLTDHGFCYATAPNPDINASVKSLGKRTEPGDFSAELTNLEDNKKYYVRPFASFSGGTIYGDQKEISTLKTGRPRINTSAISEIAISSAICGGSILSDSGYAVTSSGICWDIDNQFNENQCLGKASNTTGNTTFSLNITELAEGNTYYVKAYAKNQKGSGYGEIIVFSTTPATVPDVTTANTSNTTTNSSTGGGNVTNAGNATVTARGVCWNTTGNPTLQNCLGFTTDGQGTGTFTSNISNLTDGVKYYVKAYATNSKGTGYGNQVDFTTLPITVPSVNTSSITNQTINSAIGGGNVTNSGNATVTARGVCWNTTGNPTLKNCVGFTPDGQGTGSFTSSITNLNAGTKYYVKAYATNSKGTGYGDQVDFTTLSITVPSVITSSITNQTTNSATGGGNVINSGNASVTARGVCWNTTGNPTLQNCISFTSDGNGTGSFTSNINGLNESTTYFVKAYATNSEGSAYGNQETFTTVSSCGTILNVTHTAGTIAPVTKTVNYGTVLTDLTGSNKCWITRNLGADQQPTSATNSSETQAGWYWQFNKKRGFKHDGSTRTPSTAWVTSINEDFDWQAANDPCSLLLGNDWRLPTKTELESTDASGGWDSYNDSFFSVLKIHAAGYLSSSDGSLTSRGLNGRYWSNNQSNTGNGWYLNIGSSYCILSNVNKSVALPVRCLKD